MQPSPIAETRGPFGPNLRNGTIVTPSARDCAGSDRRGIGPWPGRLRFGRTPDGRAARI